jgi:peptidyl-tRNA hydrolase, PTH1 family
MKLVVGLGNPGREYDGTRHNLGFMLVDRIFEKTGGTRWRKQASAETAEIAVRGLRVMLVKPQTYMNLSGEAVRALLDRYGDQTPGNLIVACDDVALPFGMIRVRSKGSSGGQKGLKSIIDAIGSSGFARVRMGIQPDHPVADLSKFVLSPLPKSDRGRLSEVLERAAEAIEVVLIEGAEKAMALFNERVKTVADE